MKKKLSIINALMGLAVLFAILFQSIDAMGHLEKQFSEKRCHHVYNHHKTEISHSHESLDHCFACEFAFSNFVAPQKPVFYIRTTEPNVKYSFSYSREIIGSFRGSLFALRAPPIFIA